ncbi:unnamed protein product [Caenorhabditis sp. 36 PRJEB53466]|nr:unnamed protein product [Caenorhabditis sp. 36 PRJEB53466]
MKRAGDSAMNEAKKSKDADLFGRPLKKTGTWESKDDGDLIIFTHNDVEGKEKIAAFDMDGTLITTKSGKVFPTDCSDWKLLYDHIGAVLKKWHSDGYKIVIFTNQKGIQVGKVDRNEFKKKIEAIVVKIGVPIQAFVSVAGGIYRKPCIGMWEELKQKNDGVEINVSESVFVGDAAGRHKTKTRSKKDHSFADRLFAANVGVEFKTPEQFFGKSAADEPWGPPAFNPKDLFTEGIEQFEPKDAHLKKKGVEIVVMVGFPGSGKSTVAKMFADEHKYKLVSRDNLGSWEKCVATTRQHLRSGHSVVVDNTSPDVESRKRYVDVAKELSVPCRCFVMQCSLEHAQHNIRFRKLTNENALDVPTMALRIHKSKFVEPTEQEGFEQIVKVNFRPRFEQKEHEKLYRISNTSALGAANPGATAPIPADSIAQQPPGDPASASGAPPAEAGGAPPGGSPGGDASIAFVTKTYANYVQDIQQAAEGLRQRALVLQQEGPAQLQQLQSQIQPQTQEIVSALQEMQSPIGLPTSSVVEIFGWSSILLLSAGISSILGGYVLSPILGIFIGRLGAALLASLILPATAAYYLNGNDGSTAETRFQLLLLSIVQGGLLGHAISYTYISGQPLGFITPLVIAFAYPLVAGQVGTAHAPLLGGSVGAAFAVQSVLGLVSGSFSLSYLLLAAFYSASSAGLLQIAFRHLNAPSRIHLYQILLVGSFLFSKALVYGVFGSAEAPKLSN